MTARAPGGDAGRDRVAAIDCGTNSFRLLVAEPGPAGGLVELTRELQIVRLGQGVDATGELHPDALARTFVAAERYAELLRGRRRGAGADPVGRHLGRPGRRATWRTSSPGSASRLGRPSPR